MLQSPVAFVRVRSHAHVVAWYITFVYRATYHLTYLVLAQGCNGRNARDDSVLMC